MEKQDFDILFRLDSEEGKELLRLIKACGGKVLDMVAEQENLYMKWIDLRNRPLLVLILGSSNLNKDHYHQLTKVIGEQKFNSLDFLVQVVTGDPQVGYEIAKFVRERVSGELSCIVPLTLSGAGTVIASSSDEIIGGDITYVGPADVSSIHPSIVSWSECTGQLAPMYFDNEKEYDAHRPEAVDFVKALLDDNPSFTKGHTEEIVEFMTFSPSALIQMSSIGLKVSSI